MPFRTQGEKAAATDVTVMCAESGDTVQARVVPGLATPLLLVDAACPRTGRVLERAASRSSARFASRLRPGAYPGYRSTPYQLS